MDGSTQQYIVKKKQTNLTKRNKPYAYEQHYSSPSDTEKNKQKKQYTINTKIQMDMVDYQAATHV